MPKNIEDIIPSGRKSIRNVPIPVRRVEKPREVPKVPERDPDSLPRVTAHTEHAHRRHRHRSRIWTVIGGIVGVAAVVFAVLALQSGATLAYTPKKVTLNFNKDSYTAHQAPTGDELPFSVIKLSGEKSVTVPASGEETVSVRAEGRVVIYNEQSAAQPLVKTTRLETEDGKIYRIQADVTVPAKGNVEVLAVADQPGPSYNIPLSDFTIPGFKGSPKYGLVYARSKSPMSGGFSGTRKKVSDTDLAEARISLEGTLRDELLNQARAQMPEDFILFPELAVITHEILPVTSSAAETAQVTLRGDLSAAIFKKGDLAEHLAGEKNVAVDDFSSLAVAPEDLPADLSKADTIEVSISGAAMVRYLTDESSLASDLLGVHKDGVKNVLADYPSIESADAIIRPFWESSFPNEISEIKIERRN